MPAAVQIQPDGSTENVATTASFRLRFDRYLLPATALRQALCIQGVVAAPVKTLEDCAQGRIFLAPQYDPVLRELTLYQADGSSPLKQLAPNTRYQLTMFVPAAEGCNPPDDVAPECSGVRAFDEAPIENLPQTPISYQFTTSDTEPMGVEVETPDAVDVYNQPECPDEGCAISVAAVLLGCSTGVACHGPGVVKDTTTQESFPNGAAEGLDLRDACMTNLTAISRVAHQTQTGEHADDPDLAPPRFGRAMPLIDPGNPGNSYLLYKLMVSPSFAAPDAETLRLRNTVVVGMPMPPSPTLPNPAKDIPRISRWIAQGAPLPVPPACK